ncbi:hypothetical protein pb186bvf_001360 [Paramecium bursaria]
MNDFFQQRLEEGIMPIIQNNLMYRILKRYDTEEAFGLISKCFTTKEGFAKSIGCSEQEYYDQLEGFKEDYLVSQLSVVVVDILSLNRIIGVVLGQDFYKPSLCKPKLSSKIQQLLLFTQEFKSRSEQILENLNIQKKEGNVFFSSKAAVHDDYMGQSLIRKINQIQQRQAQLRGFKYIIACLFSPYLQKDKVLQKESQQLFSQDITEEMLKQKFQNVEIQYQMVQSDFKDETPKIVVVRKSL